MIDSAKCKVQSAKLQRGFTLLELLVVMIVLLTISGVIAGILFSSIRGASKTNAVTMIRQNGNYAISQMSKMLRDAQRLEAPFPCTLPPTPTPTPFYTSITITSFDGGTTTFACTGEPSATIASQSGSRDISLLDTNAVRVSSCSFTCSQASTLDYPTIDVVFTLSQRNPNALFEKRASETFKTSVTLRNVGR